MRLEIIFLIYMYKKDLALNNLQWLLYYQTKLYILMRLFFVQTIQKVRIHYCQLLLLRTIDVTDCWWNFHKILLYIWSLLSFQCWVPNINPSKRRKASSELILLKCVIPNRYEITINFFRISQAWYLVIFWANIINSFLTFLCSSQNIIDTIYSFICLLQFKRSNAIIINFLSPYLFISLLKEQCLK